MFMENTKVLLDSMLHDIKNFKITLFIILGPVIGTDPGEIQPSLALSINSKRTPLFV